MGGISDSPSPLDGMGVGGRSRSARRTFSETLVVGGGFEMHVASWFSSSTWWWWRERSVGGCGEESDGGGRGEAGRTKVGPEGATAPAHRDAASVGLLSVDRLLPFPLLRGRPPAALHTLPSGWEKEGHRGERALPRRPLLPSSLMTVGCASAQEGEGGPASEERGGGGGTSDSEERGGGVRRGKRCGARAALERHGHSTSTSWVVVVGAMLPLPRHVP